MQKRSSKRTQNVQIYPIQKAVFWEFTFAQQRSHTKMLKSFGIVISAKSMLFIRKRIKIEVGNKEPVMETNMTM